MKRWTPILMTAFTLALCTCAWACPLCKDSVPSSDAQAPGGVPGGFNTTIYLMLGTPLRRHRPGHHNPGPRRPRRESAARSRSRIPAQVARPYPFSSGAGIRIDARGCAMTRPPRHRLILALAILTASAWLLSLWLPAIVRYSFGEYGPGPVLASAGGCVLIGMGRPTEWPATASRPPSTTDLAGREVSKRSSGSASSVTNRESNGGSPASTLSPAPRGGAVAPWPYRIGLF